MMGRGTSAKQYPNMARPGRSRVRAELFVLVSTLNRDGKWSRVQKDSQKNQMPACMDLSKTDAG